MYNWWAVLHPRFAVKIWKCDNSIEQSRRVEFIEVKLVDSRPKLFLFLHRTTISLNWLVQDRTKPFISKQMQRINFSGCNDNFRFKSKYYLSGNDSVARQFPKWTYIDHLSNLRNSGITWSSFANFRHFSEFLENLWAVLNCFWDFHSGFLQLQSGELDCWLNPRIQNEVNISRPKLSNPPLAFSDT